MKPRKTFTLSDLANTPAGRLPENQHHFVDANKKDHIADTGKKKSKFRNEKVETEDGTFDSKKEAKEWKKQLLRLRAGQIYALSRQTKFELNPGGTHSVEYRADITFFESATHEFNILDIKGFRTKVYLKKKKLMETVLNLKITEL